MNNRTVSVNGKDYRVLYIGLRGSHCLGLQTEESDKDYLYVLDTGESLGASTTDDMYVSKHDFTLMVLQGEIEAIEALFYKDYLTNAYKDTYHLLASTVKLSYSVYDKKLRYKLFRATRNQFKLAELYLRKGEEKRACKHLAKLHLYYCLSQNQNSLMAFMNHNVNSHLKSFYHSVKSSSTVDIDLLESYRDIGSNKQTRKAIKDELLSTLAF